MSESNEVVEGSPIKNKKALRYYYRHREEIKAKRMEKLMGDPEYRAKKEAQEAAKRKREEEKKAKEEERNKKRQERALKKEAELKEKEETRERKRLEKAAELGAIPSGPKS